MSFYEKIENNFKNSLGDKYNGEKLFTKATDEQLDELRNLIGDNASAFIDFYANLQPYNLSMMNCYASLCDIQHIIEENIELAPGAYLSKLGIFVFGVTIGGNSVCIDTNNMQNGDPCVLIIDQSFLYCDEDDDEVEIANLPSYIDESKLSNEDYEFTYENVRKFVYKLEDRFTDFIEKFSRDEYEDLESFI